MAQAAAASANQSFSLEKASILIIDGDGFSANILGQILSGFGARNVARCTSVTDAKTLLTDAKFHIVALDPTSLDDDGYALVAWLRRAKTKNKHTPVLVSTGHTQKSAIATARDAGVNVVVSKPLSPAKVFDRLTWILRDRPYIECPAYAGPDRRVRTEGPPAGLTGRREEDRMADVDLSAGDLTQPEIDSLLDHKSIDPAATKSRAVSGSA